MVDVYVFKSQVAKSLSIFLSKLNMANFNIATHAIKTIMHAMLFVNINAKMRPKVTEKKIIVQKFVNKIFDLKNFASYLFSISRKLKAASIINITYTITVLKKIV